MDRRDDAMSLPGSASYFMQRGLSGSGGLSIFDPLPNQNLQFHSNIGSNSTGTTLLVEQSSTFSLPDANSLRLATASVKRKRGRPRKYGPEGGAGSSALTPSISSLPTLMPSSTLKRGRGRPLGSGGKKNRLEHSIVLSGDWVSGSAGIGFTPHLFIVAVGEDISTKIMSFSQERARAVCVMSANGSVSTATLRQPSTSGGTVTYEGHFEILCLSGSYLRTNNGVSQERSGGLGISLASPNGRVTGGGVGGVLIAATPIQVILGSFVSANSKTKNKTREGSDGTIDSDLQTLDNPVILGSFVSANSKTKNKTREGPDGTIDSDLQTLDNPVSPTSIQQHNQRLNNSTSLLGVWPIPRSVDRRNAQHLDINLMRG